MDLDLGGVVGSSQGHHEHVELPPADATNLSRATQRNGDDEQAPHQAIVIPPRASSLFNAGSCAWSGYYADLETLEAVGTFYAEDFSLFRWYSLEEWRQKLKSCLSDA